MRARWAVAIALVAACSSELVTPAPAPATGQGAGGSSDGEGGAGGAGGMAPVKRKVIQRNPFGDVQKADNLLWDGDFEWLSSFADQYGWLSGKNVQSLGYNLPKQVIGARCKSGVKCAEIGPDAVFIAIGVASKGSSLAGSFYAAVDGACTQIDAALLTPAKGDDAVAMFADSKLPVDGWCHYTATVSERTSAAWIYIHNGGKTAALVDDASIQPTPPKPSQSAPAVGPAAAPQDFSALRAKVAELQRPSPRPESEDEQRFREQTARRRAE